jgi:hypothetical protein
MKHHVEKTNRYQDTLHIAVVYQQQTPRDFRSVPIWISSLSLSLSLLLSPSLSLLYNIWAYRNLGAIFHLMRSAESYDRENKELLQRNFELTSFSPQQHNAAHGAMLRKPYATGLAVDLIAHRLTPAELAGLQVRGNDSSFFPRFS